MSLLHPRLHYKPFAYPWAYDAWKRQQQVHWIADEVPLHEDVKDWHQKLSPAEKNLLTQIFRFFTQADIDVADCYMRKYASVFRPPEVTMMLTAFAAMESIHVDAYSHLMTTIGMPEVEYSAFMQYKEMRDKHAYGEQFSTDTPMGAAKTLAVFGAFTEGLQLFASFAILMNFPRQNKMKGMGQIVSYSARDETLHCENIIRLFHTLVDEEKLPFNSLLVDLAGYCKEIVANEDRFIDLAFEQGPVEGLTAEAVKEYVRWIANRRMIQLGGRAIFPVFTNPLPWMDEMLNAVEHANFFETRATEYSKAATKGSWGDVDFSRPREIHIFTQDGCRFCTQAKELMMQVGLGHFEERNLTDNPALKTSVYHRTGRHTLPLIYFDGQLVGGFDDLARRLGVQ